MFLISIRKSDLMLFSFLKKYFYWFLFDDAAEITIPRHQVSQIPQ